MLYYVKHNEHIHKQKSGKLEVSRFKLVFPKASVHARFHNGFSGAWK
jgi:hypothetical protein